MSSTAAVQCGAKEVMQAYARLAAKQAKCGLDAAGVIQRGQISREMGALYRRDIVSRPDVLDMPLMAADYTDPVGSLNTLSGTLVTQRTLELLKLNFPVLSRIVADYSDQPAVYGQTVMTRYISIPGVATFNTSTGWADATPTTNDVPVTMNAHKGVPITFLGQILGSTTRRLFDEFAPAASYALAKDLVDALYALILKSTFTNTAITSGQADFGRPTVINASVALNKLGVPGGPQNRTLLLSSDFYGKLAQDKAIVTLAAFQQSEIITGTQLPEVSGFLVVDAPNLPTTGGLAGFGFSKSALVIATRTPGDYVNALPGASYGNSAIVTDPSTGIAVHMVQYVNHQMAQATMRLSLMYGVAAGQVKAGQIIATS